jgi:hypothetical protein
MEKRKRKSRSCSASSVPCRQPKQRKEIATAGVQAKRKSHCLADGPVACQPYSHPIWSPALRYCKTESAHDCKVRINIKMMLNSGEEYF